MITLRQEKLLQRYLNLRLKKHMPNIVTYKEVGVGIVSLNNFVNGSKKLSELTLDKLERFIIKKEQEFVI